VAGEKEMREKGLKTQNVFVKINDNLMLLQLTSL
jgi:hypothetical protein